jgi:type I restriction enzyme S subunit
MNEFDWPSVRFSDLLEGGTRNGIYKKKEFHGSGVKVVNMGELFAHPRLFSVPMKRLELTEKELHKSQLAQGDLLFARRSLTAEGAGKCSIVMDVDEPTVFESSIIRARLAPRRSDSLFYYYFFNSPQGKSALESIRRQVAVAGITGGDLVKLEVPAPPLNVQRGVSRALGLFDEKIELNRLTARTLEDLAQRLFRSWFVDFDPVRAKMAGRQPAHTPPEIADLFPDRLVDSPLGLIPESWEPKKLSDIATINPESYTPKTLPQSIDYIDISSVGDGWCQGASTLTKDEAPSRARRAAKPGDTIWSLVRPNRRAHFYFDTRFSSSTVISTGFAVIRPRHAPTFSYFLLDQATFSDYLERRATGAAYPAVNAKAMADFEFVWPGAPLVEAFDQVASSLKARQASLRLENQTLAKLRDRLLPELISGSTRIPWVGGKVSGAQR